MTIRRTYEAPRLLPRKLFGFTLPVIFSWIFGYIVNNPTRADIDLYLHTNDRTMYRVNLFITYYRFKFIKEHHSFYIRKVVNNIYITNPTNPLGIWHLSFFITNDKLRSFAEKRVKAISANLNDVIRSHPVND